MSTTSDAPGAEFTVCEDEGCDEKVKNHRWGRTKAEGWLELKDGRMYCPKHIPEWYAKWKAKKDGH